MYQSRRTSRRLTAGLAGLLMALLAFEPVALAGQPKSRTRKASAGGASRSSASRTKARPSNSSGRTRKAGSSTPRRPATPSSSSSSGRVRRAPARSSTPQRSSGAGTSRSAPTRSRSAGTITRPSTRSPQVQQRSTVKRTTTRPAATSSSGAVRFPSQASASSNQRTYKAQAPSGWSGDSGSMRITRAVPVVRGDRPASLRVHRTGTYPSRSSRPGVSNSNLVRVLTPNMGVAGRSSLGSSSSGKHVIPGDEGRGGQGVRGAVGPGSRGLVRVISPHRSSEAGAGAVSGTVTYKRIKELSRVPRSQAASLPRYKASVNPPAHVSFRQPRVDFSIDRADWGFTVGRQGSDRWGSVRIGGRSGGCASSGGTRAWVGSHWWNNQPRWGGSSLRMVLPQYPTYNGWVQLYEPTCGTSRSSWGWSGRSWGRSSWPSRRSSYSCYRSPYVATYTYWPGWWSTRTVHHYYHDDEPAEVAYLDEGVVVRRDVTEPAGSATNVTPVTPVPTAVPQPVVSAPGAQALELAVELEDCHVQFLVGDYAGAQQCYVRQVLLGESEGRAGFGYGLASFALGDYDAAAAGFRRALQLAPELMAEPIDVVPFYFDVELLNEQLERLATAVAEQGDYDAAFTLGYVCYCAGLRDVARAVLTDVSAADPGDVIVQQLLEQIPAVRRPAIPQS